MRPASGSAMHRLRASKLVRAVLLLLALASAGAGFHAASHLVAADHGGYVLPLAQDDPDDNTGSHPLDCPACRLVGTWAFALAPALHWVLHYVPAEQGRFKPPTPRPVTDPQERWQQLLKHSPPQFSR
jgi:hypothetical protein